LLISISGDSQFVILRGPADELVHFLEASGIRGCPQDYKDNLLPVLISHTGGQTISGAADEPGFTYQDLEIAIGEESVSIVEMH